MKQIPNTVALNTLLLQHEWVRALARTLVGAHEDADDVEQDAWLEALRSPSEKVSPRGWLTTVLRRAAFHLRRRDRVRREREGAVQRCVEVRSTAEVVAQAELQTRVARTVLALPEPYRDTILLRFYEGLTLPEIARRAEVPLETIRSRLRRGLVILRSEFEHGDGTEWRRSLAPLAGAKGAALAAGGAFLMSKAATAVAAIVVLGLSWIGWTVLPGRGGPNPVPVGSTKPEATDEPRASDDRGSVPVAPIRPQPFSDPETATSSRNTSRAGRVTRGTAAVTGLVLAPDGSPVEGASVIAGDPETQVGLLRDEDGLRLNLKLVFSLDPILYPSNYAPKTKTDAKGAFRFDDVGVTARLTVAAYHPEFGLAAAFGIPVREGDQRAVTLRYESGVRFFGTVTDQNQQPVHLAKVWLTGFREDGRAQSLPFVQTDASGSYRTELAAGNQFHLRATAEGYYTAVARVKALPAGTREHRVDLAFERAPRLRGRLRANDGSPARVVAHMTDLFGREGPDPAHRLVLLVAFDDPRKDPNFRSIDREEGRLLEKDDAYELVPESKSVKYLSLWLGADLIGLAEVAASDVAPDIIVDWSKASRPTPRGALDIVVKSAEDDSPVTNYDVRIEGPLDGRAIERSQWGQIVSAEDGRFTFDRLLSGRYDVRVTANGFDEGRITTDARVAPDVGQAVLALVPRSRSAATASIVGVVKGPHGEPINGATVWIIPDAAERRSTLRKATTDAEGSFRVERLLPESYVAVAEPPRGARLAPAWTRFTAPSESVAMALVDGVRVEVIPEGTVGPFAFRVVDESGVALIDDSRSRGQAWGTRHGFILPAGRYEVHATSPNFTSARGQLIATEGASVTLVLTPEPK